MSDASRAPRFEAGFVRRLRAELRDRPPTVGICAVAGPLDTVSVTVEPLSAFTPPAGSVLITVPSARSSELCRFVWTGSPRVSSAVLAAAWSARRRPAPRPASGRCSHQQQAAEPIAAISNSPTSHSPPAPSTRLLSSRRPAAVGGLVVRLLRGATTGRTGARAVERRRGRASSAEINASASGKRRAGSFSSSAGRRLRNVGGYGRGKRAGVPLSTKLGAQSWGRKCIGSPAWIRTTIHGSKGRCPTIRRPGKFEGLVRTYSIGRRPTTATHPGFPTMH